LLGSNQSANEIAEWELRNWFSVVCAVTIAVQQLSKQALNNGATLFLWGLCRGVTLKTIGVTEQFSAGDRHGKFSAGDSHGKFACEEELQTI
jgi:hypothetical protein